MTSNTDNKSSAAITLFLASNGANLYLKNNKDQTPLDLCPDPHLLKLLNKSSMEYHKAGRTEPDSLENDTPVRIRVKVRNQAMSLRYMLLTPYAPPLLYFK